MDPWDHIRRAAADERSGSAEIAARAAAGLAGLRSRRDVLRAARALLRAHPSMGALWRLLSEAHSSDDVARAAGLFTVELSSQTWAAADGARWVVTKRGSVILTHSASSAVVAALERVRGRVARVICTQSLPGGEGRAIARLLERGGFEVGVIPDAAIGEAAEEADVAFVGADAVTEEGVVNKIGTRLVALAARSSGAGCYALACGVKMVPARVARAGERFESTPLALFDAVLTEHGALRPAAVRRAVARVRIPRALERLAQ